MKQYRLTTAAAFSRLYAVAIGCKQIAKNNSITEVNSANTENISNRVAAQLKKRNAGKSNTLS